MNSRNPGSLDFASALVRFNTVRFKDELVPDERYRDRPSEVVQRKLQSAIAFNHLPISSLHVQRLVRR